MIISLSLRLNLSSPRHFPDVFLKTFTNLFCPFDFSIIRSSSYHCPSFSRPHCLAWSLLAISTLPIIAPPTPLETVSIWPDRWLSIEKWFMNDIESLSLDEETSTGESKVAGEEGEFRFYLWSSFRGRCYRPHQGRRSQSQR